MQLRRWCPTPSMARSWWPAARSWAPRSCSQPRGSCPWRSTGGWVGGWVRGVCGGVGCVVGWGVGCGVPLPSTACAQCQSQSPAPRAQRSQPPSPAQQVTSPAGPHPRLPCRRAWCQRLQSTLLRRNPDAGEAAAARVAALESMFDREAVARGTSLLDSTGRSLRAGSSMLMTTMPGGKLFVQVRLPAGLRCWPVQRAAPLGPACCPGRPAAADAWPCTAPVPASAPLPCTGPTALHWSTSITQQHLAEERSKPCRLDGWRRCRNRLAPSGPPRTRGPRRGAVCLACAAALRPSRRIRPACCSTCGMARALPLPPPTPPPSSPALRRPSAPPGLASSASSTSWGRWRTASCAARCWTPLWATRRWTPTSGGLQGGCCGGLLRGGWGCLPGWPAGAALRGVPCVEGALARRALRRTAPSSPASWKPC
jgi:hypothetical protein